MASQQLDFVRDVFDLTGARWTMPVLAALDTGRKRFGELARDVGGIAQKQLSATLRELERDGFVTRLAYASIPPRVEYELTELGHNLVQTASLLGHFAVKNGDAIAAARAEFDRRASAPDLPALSLSSPRSLSALR